MLGLRSGGFTATEISDREVSAAGPSEMALVRVRPYKETPGIDSGPRVWQALYRDPARTTVPTYTWEPWFDESRIKFVIGAPRMSDVLDLLNSHYSNSRTETLDAPLPDISPGEFVAGARLALSKDCAFPIKSSDSVTAFDGDPYTTLLPKLVGEASDRVVFQLVARPVREGWYNRGVMGADADKIADGVRRGRVVGEVNPQIIQSEQDKEAAKDIQRQRNKPAYETTIRILAFSETPEAAERRAEAVSTVVTEYYNHATDQGFEADILTGRRLRREVRAAASRTLRTTGRTRRWLRGPSNILTATQVAGVAHLPNESVGVPEVDWSRMTSGPGVPPDAPQFDSSEVT